MEFSIQVLYLILCSFRAMSLYSSILFGCFSFRLLHFIFIACNLCLCSAWKINRVLIIISGTIYAAAAWQIMTQMNHHHHYLFWNCSFLPCFARVRRLTISTLSSPSAQPWIFKMYTNITFVYWNKIFLNCSALNICSVDLLLKIGTLLPEIAIYEKNVDSFIELLRKDQVLYFILFLNVMAWNFENY